MMRGQILDAAITSNRGLILGDDGARYAFGEDGWEDSSVKAVAGMLVEFSPLGGVAMEVSAAQQPAPPPPVPTPPAQPVSPVNSQPAQPRVGQVSPQQRSYTVPASPVPRTSQPGAPQANRPPSQRPGFTAPATPVQRTTPSNFVPRYPRAEADKAIIGLLLIFLGPLGNLISYFIIGARPGQWIAIVIMGVLILVAISTFPPFAVIVLIAWYMGCLIGGIYLLVISDESWNRQMHYQRDHPQSMFGPHKSPEFCRTGICRGNAANEAATPHTRR